MQNLNNKMKIRLVQKGNPAQPEAPKKWYANAVNQGTVNKQQISKEIAGRSSLTRGDISNVLDNLIDELPKYLKAGNSVKLGDFGTFRLSVLSKGSDTAESYNTASHVKGVKVIFTPGTALKNELSEIHFEKVNES